MIDKCGGKALANPRPMRKSSCKESLRLYQDLKRVGGFDQHVSNAQFIRCIDIIVNQKQHNSFCCTQNLLIGWQKPAATSKALEDIALLRAPLCICCYCREHMRIEAFARLTL